MYKSPMSPSLNVNIAAPLQIAYSAHMDTAVQALGCWYWILRFVEDTMWFSFVVNVVMGFAFRCLVALSVFIWGFGEFENYAAILLSS